MKNEILDLQDNNRRFLNKGSIDSVKRDYAIKTLKWMETYAPGVFAHNEFFVFRQQVQALQYALANLKSPKDKVNKKTKELDRVLKEVIQLWSPA
jgi:hypothetical protein